MAFQGSSAVNAALAVVIQDELEDQFNRKATFLSMLEKKQGFGQSLAWDAVTSAGTAGAYTEGADVGSSDLTQDNLNPASLGWGRYRGAFGLSDFAQAVATSSVHGPEQLRDLMKENLRTKLGKLVSVLNVDAFAGDGTGGKMTGIGLGFDATTDYAGIDASVYTEWQGTVDGNGSTPRALTEALMQGVEDSIFDACGDKPTVIVTTSRVATKFENLFTRRTILAPGELSPRHGSVPIPALREGDTGLSFRGIPIFRDKDCPTGEMHFVNLNEICMRYLAQAVPSTATQNGLLSTPQGLMVKLKSLATIGSSDRWMVNIFPQIQVKRRNAHGYIFDIDES